MTLLGTKSNLVYWTLLLYFQAHDTSCRAMQWSHNDNWMVTADHFGYIKYWQSNMNNVKMYQGHKEPIRGLRYHHLHMDFLNSRIHDKSVHLFVCGFVSDCAASLSSSYELDPSGHILCEETRNITMWVFPVAWTLSVKYFFDTQTEMLCFSFVEYFTCSLFDESGRLS